MPRQAILSVSNKSGLIEFAHGLIRLGWALISTGGTAKYLIENGIRVTPVSEITGFPEIMDGRVKTLHPNILAGILADRSTQSHLDHLDQLGIKTIDLVVVNLYPFEEVAQQNIEGFNNLRSQKFEAIKNKAIENIDIGGPTMLRAAAKNFHSVTVVVDPNDYELVLEELEKGVVSLETRKLLAMKVFARTAKYDSAVAAYFSKGEYLNLNFEKVSDLRYGENPHQHATFYREVSNSSQPPLTRRGGDDAISPLKPALSRAEGIRGARDIMTPSVTNAQILQGKELSFNNILDANAALNLIQEFEEPAAAVIKHNNPCGVASADQRRLDAQINADDELITKAFKMAWDADPLSAFGGIVALNRPCTKEIAEALSKEFIEIVLAPDFSPETLAFFKSKPNLRLLRYNSSQPPLTRRGGDDAISPLKPALSRAEGIRGGREATGVQWTPGGGGVMNLDFKRITGGLLVQDADTSHIIEKDLKIVTKKHPSEEEVRDMLFAWKVVKHCKSNAIVLARHGMTVGLGLGQTSRVGSVHIAVEQLKNNFQRLSASGRIRTIHEDSPKDDAAGHLRKSARKPEESKNIVCASDAFFPFRDSIDELAHASVTAIIQPGGSRNDQEVISAADEHAISMAFTGIRVFRH